MKRTVIALCIAVLTLSVPATGKADRVLYAVDVSNAGPRAMDALRLDRGVRWWVELGDVLVVSGTRGSFDRASDRHDVTRVEAPRGDERLFVGHRIHPNELEISRPGGCQARILASSGTFSLVAATPTDAAMLESHEPGSLEPAGLNVAYARSSRNEAPRYAEASKTRELSLYADAVNAERWRATVADLAAFRTRYVGTLGNASARDYIAAEMQALGLTVSTPAFAVGGATAYNVVGEIVGTSRPSDLYIVCGHYDSISEQPLDLAPGAEDNGSGAAGVVELARVFAANPPAATVRFIAFSGEEEGLWGSKAYVDRLGLDGEASRVKAVINMDMIGYSGDDDLDVLLETGRVGRDLQDALAESAAAVTSLRVVTSLNPFGSDHVPFIRAGIPCVLTIQNDWDDYPDYHTSRDSIDNVRTDMGGQILRMNAAALGALVGEPTTGTTPDVAVSVPFATNRQTIHGGFAQTVRLTVGGGEPTSFDLEYSLDGGATYTTAGNGIAGDRREIYWIVPEGARSNDGQVRVTAHFADGTDVSAVTAADLRIRPDDGPHIKAVKLKPTVNGDILLTGRFGSEYQQIQVNGVAIDATLVSSAQIDGNTVRKLVGSVSSLDVVFPQGVEVAVRVVDLRTGVATPELRVTR